MRKTLTITSDRFLQDHCIDDHVVLPTVCAHELMCQVAQYLCADKKVVELNDYKLYQGIVFDGFESVDLLLDYQLEDLGESTKLTLKVASQKATSKTSGALQYHYGAELKLLDNSAEPKQGEIINTDFAMAADEPCMQYYQNGCLFHGPSLQGLQKILAFDASGLQVQIKLENNQVLAPSFSASGSHVFANDLVYQALLLWVFKQHDVNSLPTATKQWRYYQVPTDAEMLLSLNIIETNQHKTTADIQWLDDNGDLIAMIEGVEVTHAKGLRDKFLASSAKHQQPLGVVANG